MSDQQPTQAPPAVKPGYKTTEFWLAIAANLAGALATSGVLGNGQAERVVGLVVIVLASLGYTASRTIAKNGPTS